MAAKARSYTIKKGQVITPIKEVIPKAVHEIAKDFLNPPLKCFGYYGIQKLSTEMIKWLDSTPNPKRDFYDQADLMENSGTGGAVFRNLFRDFLFECLEHLYFERLKPHQPSSSFTSKYAVLLRGYQTVDADKYFCNGCLDPINKQLAIKVTQCV